jgi:hypothetical protein
MENDNKKKENESVENTPEIEKIENGEELAGGMIPPPLIDPWGTSGMTRSGISIKESL